MVGFFEKRIMQDVFNRVQKAWPNLNVKLIESDYNTDGLAIRVWAHQRVFFDLTIHNGRWTSIIGGTEDERPVPSSQRVFDQLRLSVGAPAAQAADEWMRYMKLNWNEAQNLGTLLTESGQAPTAAPAHEGEPPMEDPGSERAKNLLLLADVREFFGELHPLSDLKSADGSTIGLSSHIGNAVVGQLFVGQDGCIRAHIIAAGTAQRKYALENGHAPLYYYFELLDDAALFYLDLVQGVRTSGVAVDEVDQDESPIVSQMYPQHRGKAAWDELAKGLDESIAALLAMTESVARRASTWDIDGYVHTLGRFQEAVPESVLEPMVTTFLEQTQA